MIQKDTAKTGKRLSKTTVTAIILALVFLLALGGYFLVKQIRQEEEPTEETPSNLKLLYDSFSFTGEAYDFTLKVTPAKAAEDEITPDNIPYRIEKKPGENVYRLSTYDEVTDQYQYYLPSVMQEDPFFTYTDLYATDSLGYAEVWRLFYLSAGIGKIYYAETIEVMSEERLKLFGLDDDHATKFSFSYQQTESSEIVERTVWIGDARPDGKGYYVCLGNDKTVIYPTESDTLSYVKQPFSYYVKPRLVASGLTSSNTNNVYNDGSYEPYLTSSFKEWKNTTKIYNPNEAEEKQPFVPNDVYELVLQMTQTSSQTGYKTSDKYSVSLLSLSDTLQTKIKAQTIGKRVGPNAFSVTETDRSLNGNLHSLADKNTEITYTVKRVDAIVTDGADVLTGTVGTGAETLLITYERDGETKHGALLLSEVKDCVTEGLTALQNAEIGEDFEEPITVKVQYDDCAASFESILSAVMVYAVYDASGNIITTATENSIVGFMYKKTVNGEVTDSGYTYVDLADTTDEYNARFRAMFIGKTAGEEPADGGEIVRETTYGEQIFNYTQLTSSIVSRYVTREWISAFAFANANERDAFYGETYYKNTLPATDPHSAYGVDGAVCEDIARLLGGLEGDSSTSAGLYGTETLAVGLTPDVMEQFGLYAYTVYYELPRGLDSELLEDGQTSVFTWDYTLGTYLYVSEEQPDGTRYVGSSLYDIVTKVDGSVFYFLDGSFNETFARKDVVMVDIEKVDSVLVSGNLDELKGDYLISYLETATDTKNYMITPSGDYLADNTKLNGYIAERTLENPALLTFSLNKFYRTVSGLDTYQSQTGSHGESAGDSYFREWIQALWATQYSGELADGTASIEGKDELLSLTFTLNNGKAYTYRFYRISDRQVAVRLEYPEKTPAQDFYISTLAFKKIGNCFLSLLNAEIVDGEVGYGD